MCIRDSTFPGYAEFHSYGKKYVLVKSAKLWEVDTHEYLFFVLADALDETQVRDLVSVSYTHLDVYKRQILEAVANPCFSAEAPFAQAAKAAGLTLPNLLNELVESALDA